MNIYQRMLKVMEAVSYVQKEEKKVNNQYTFVSHDAVTKKIRPELVKNGIVAIARVISHTQDGNRTEADVEVDFVNAEKPDEKVTISAFGYGIDPQDKGPGKAISYAVKYAYLKAFALETGDDPERDSIPHAEAANEVAQVSEYEAAIQACDDGPSLDALAAKISRSGLSSAGKTKLRAAFSKQKNALAVPA